MSVIDLAGFWEAWPLFEDAVLAGTIAGILLGVVGVYIVLNRMVFVSAALSQTASLGVTLAYFFQTLGVSSAIASPSLGASILSLSALTLIWRNDEMARARRDSMLGVIFLIGASGTLIVASRIVQEMHDVQTLLFGTSVAVLPEDFQLILVFGVVIVGLYLWWWRGFVEVTYDEATASVRDMPVRLIKVVLMITVALAVSICTRVLGALPAFAFGVFPAMGAIALAPNIPRAVVLAAVLGGLSGFGGYLCAYLFELPVGAAQTMTGGFIWLLAISLSGLISSTKMLQKD